MKKLLVKFLVAVMAVAIMTSAFTACGNSSNTDKDGNVIVKMTMMDNEYETAGWNALIQAANGVLEAQGEKVRIQAEWVETSSWDQYFTKVTTNITGRVGGTIGRIAESHVPTMLQKGFCEDLTSLRNELVATGNFDTTAFEGVAVKNGKYYALPSGAQPMVLYYNKTLFDRYNATAADEDKISYPSGDWANASTFDEIRDMAKKLTVGSGNEKRFGLSAGPFLSYIGMYATNSGGENIFNAAGECIINTQPYIDAYTWFENMLLVDKSMPKPEDTATSDTISRFISGNTAMLVDGVWQMHYISEYVEDFEIGIAAIPVKSGYEGVAHTTTFADRIWASSTSTTKKEDKIALKALMSKEATEAAAKMLVGGFPVRTDCVDAYLDAFEGSILEDYTDVVAGSIQNRISVPYSVYYNQVDMQINQKLAVWIAGDMATQDFVTNAYDIMVRGMQGLL